MLNKVANKSNILKQQRAIPWIKRYISNSISAVSIPPEVNESLSDVIKHSNLDKFETFNVYLHEMNQEEVEELTEHSKQILFQRECNAGRWLIIHDGESLRSSMFLLTLSSVAVSLYNPGELFDSIAYVVCRIAQSYSLVQALECFTPTSGKNKVEEARNIHLILLKTLEKKKDKKEEKLPKE